MKKYLAIVCTGNKTYHNFSDKNKRNFDVCIIYYNEGNEDFFKSQCEYFFQRKSPKYKLIKEILPLIPWKKYKYIFLPDDDLTINIEDINELFLVADKNKMDLCQPSILLPNIDWKVLQRALALLLNPNEEYKLSSLWYIYDNFPNQKQAVERMFKGCSYPVLLKKYETSEKIIRSVDFIEVQCPLLSRKLLKQMYQVFQDPLVTTGFGIDYIWSQSGFVENKYVIDYISATHMNETHFKGYLEYKKGKIEEKNVAEQYQNLKMNPIDEAKVLLDKYNINKMMNLNNAIVLYIDNDYCNLTIDYGSINNTNNNLFKIIKESWEKYIKNNIPNKTIKCIISVGNTFIKDIRYKNSFSVCGTKEHYEKLIPNFNFESYKLLDIDNYEDKIKNILELSKEKYSDDKFIWLNTSDKEEKYFNEIYEKYKKNIICKNINQINKKDIFNILIKHKVILTNDYQILPYLLATGRTIVIIEKKEKDWFFYDNSFKPWIHYIPLANFSELNKIINWTNDKKIECETIGKMGQDFVFKYLKKENILQKIADVLLANTQNKKKLDVIKNQIISDINAYKYTYNTKKLLEIALHTSDKINNSVLKVEIKNNELKVIHNPNSTVFEKKAENIINIIKSALKYKKIRDGIFYIIVGDEHTFQLSEFPELPFLTIAKLKDKKGILFVDNSFVDIGEGTKNLENKSKIVALIDNKNINEKIKKDFDIGNWINEQIKLKLNIPSEIFFTDKKDYYSISDLCKYKYLINFSTFGSFRLNFLSLMKSLIINVYLYRQYEISNANKWINIFDSLFVPNRDYIEVNYYYNEKENKENKEINFQNLLTNIEEIYKIMEKDNDFYKKITNSGYEKGQIINEKNITKIAYDVLNSFSSKISNIEPNIFKYNNLDNEKLILGQIKNFSSKFIGSGIQGNIYSIVDNKTNFKWIIKITDLHIGVYDTYREVFFSDIINKINYNGFIKIYDTQILNKKIYLSTQITSGDLIKWAMDNRNYNDWLNFIIQAIIIIKKLQINNIIHNDLQPKNFLFDNKKFNSEYIIDNKKYFIKSNFQFYISDFNLSYHHNLYNINILTNEEINIPNFDLKKFSKTPQKLKAINIKNKYSYDQLIEIMKNKHVNFNDKIIKLQNKTNKWNLDFKYKQEYIHLHLSYYYVKKGFFNNDYSQNSPKPLPEKIEKIFEELSNYKDDLNNWLIKYL